MLAIGIGACVPDMDAARRRKRKKRKAVPKVTKVVYDTPVTTGKVHETEPFVTFERENPITHGLDNKVIALWQSHGLYFDQQQDRWKWQRPLLFGTVEDLFSQGFVMPYLMPMLENAGAYVMSPRERDVNLTEIIVDTDGSDEGDFYMTEGKHKWSEGARGSGFAMPQRYLVEGENPFEAGTSETVRTVTPKHADKKSTAVWSADIPARGRYAVYVSYKSLPHSATDADYTIHHLGGATKVKVNQTMGGGTWVYLGHYELASGKQPVVTLTNISDDDDDAVVSADAVKIGGGMGNVARKVKGSDVAPYVSGSPRFTEGARYWLQWAGMPLKVYSESNGTNDYTDDYKCRALWVNYLAGGSPMLPDSVGLNIPVDMAFAFHTDAGITDDGSVVGTLGIYSTDDGIRLGNNRSRSECGDLAYTVINQVTSDIRTLHRPDWTQRGIRDKKYYEIRATKVPAMIMELLSHQNFEDMKFGLDPAFRFDVARAVYKGILKFLSKRYGVSYAVQPLPVNDFAITAGGAGRYRLTWRQTIDKLELTAYPKYYVVEERVEGGAFKPVATVTEPKYDVIVTDSHIHSYRIVAGNDGGTSFPSEVLSLYDNGSGRPDVVIVNGFTRISAPDEFASADFWGFDFNRDGGVPDVADIINTGDQYNFSRWSEFENNDRPGFGASHGDRSRIVTAGNTHDFVWLHGRAIRSAGKGFVSQSVGAFMSRMPTLVMGTPANPPVVDLILGKQKEIMPGSGDTGTRYKAFPPELQLRIENHCAQGGSLMVSGAYIASDLFANNFGTDDTHLADRTFATTVLGYTWETGRAAVDGKVSVVPSPLKEFPQKKLSFNIRPTAECYAVESPDAIIPAGINAYTVMRYDENGLTAATALQRDMETEKGLKTYRVFAMGFPFEVINGEDNRAHLMRDILQYLSAKK